MTAREPVSTYRLQITADFDLFAAAGRLSYLRDLGADWVYLSPLLAAEPGSSHGYDVVAHDRVDASRGGPEGLAAFAAEARRLGLGVLVDIVPNHVGVATPAANAWWWDLLQHGRGSRYADAFDVDWDAGGGKLLLPVLGDGDGAAVHVADGELRYHELRFPLAPGTSTPDEQHYRLVGWRDADDRLNYRRFFSVTTLAGIRVEEPWVFEQTHAEIRRWFAEGLVDGLRVDHPDGLRDPRGYLDDLARLTGGAYVLVEKILEPGEELPRSWATAGTTGYDALGLVDRVLTDPAGQATLDALEARLRGGDLDWASYVEARKHDVATGILRAEVLRIVREIRRLDRTASETELEEAVAAVLSNFPVYRSYLPDGREHLDLALERARVRTQHLDPVAMDVLERVLTDPAADPALRFQQTSGMVMAKGVEDCAFYRYSRLTSLNEVGGDPSEFSIGTQEFHDAMVRRQRDRPSAMTALTTHDTKRSEDVRARITVLAEVPELWAEALDRLLELAPVPDPGFGSLLWQAVLGSWPASRERLHAYAEKAMREAGDHTTWTAPDEAYEKAVHAAVDAAFDDPEVEAVLDGLLAQVVTPGWANALAAKLVALTMPGVPDVYQGSELWEQSLVDPDNRRDVDFDARAAALEALRADGAVGLSDRPDDPGTAKLLVTHRALTARRDRPELFASYAGLEASGAAARHVLAFDRGGAVTVVTRFPHGLGARGGWGDTTVTVPPGSYREALTGRSVAGGEVPLADLLADLPVALLLREHEEDA